MNTLDFCRSQVLNNIPQKKILEVLSSINNDPDNDSKVKSLKLIAVNRYAESNIPIDYWKLKMDKDFEGDSRLFDKYNEYISDLKSCYINGTSICFAGTHGSGKTMTASSILKKCCDKGYTSLYTTLSDMVNVLSYSSGEEKIIARRELTMVDFLAIDEVDQRFFSQSEGANEMFSRTFESVIRTRLQNKLPILMASNSPNIQESFVSLFKASLGSLMNKIPVFVVMPGQDFRKVK